MTGRAPAETFDDPLPHYERAGDAFACQMTKADFERSQVEGRDVCLEIGALNVKMPRPKIEEILGQPASSKTVAGRDYFVYPLQTDKTGVVITYFVVTYSSLGQAETIQLTGAPLNGSGQFCGLGLGTVQSAVAARLGQPLQTKKSDDAGTVEWDYFPWTFSLELKNGVVSSIRVASE